MGEIRFGWVRLGKVSLNWDTLGQVRLVEIRLGTGGLKALDI